MIAKSASQLNTSFYGLSKNGYHISAMPLIRMMMDFCLTTYGFTIYKDKKVFLRHIQDDKPINRLNMGGNRLTTTFLKNKLAEVCTTDVNGLYDRSCGYIHPSSYHYNQFIAGELFTTDIEAPLKMFTDDERKFFEDVEGADFSDYDQLFEDWNEVTDLLDYLLGELVDTITSTKPQSDKFRVVEVDYQKEVKVYES